MVVSADQLRWIRDYLEGQQEQFRNGLRTCARAATLDGAEQFAPQVLYNYHALKVLKKMVSDLDSKIAKAERSTDGPGNRGATLHK